MDDQESYDILRALTSPLVALTVRRGDKLNGMVANSAIRASLVPGFQRVANYVFKRHLTHDILAETGRYVLHILSREQWDEIWALGFSSGRDRDKLEGLPYRLSDETGLPILTRAYAWMECRVINAMDAGCSTFFLGELERISRGDGREIMDSAYFRAHMPETWYGPYLDNLADAQEKAAAWSEPLDDRAWRDLHSGTASG